MTWSGDQTVGSNEVTTNRWFEETVIHTNPTSYVVINNATARAALTTTLTKRLSTSLLVATVSGQVINESGVEQNFYFGLRIGGTDYNVSRVRMLIAPDRKTFSAERSIAGLTAGALTIEPVVQSSGPASLRFTSGYDSLSYSVREVSA
jgi:hypothetical protein